MISFVSLLQNSSLTWETDHPKFTDCFQQSVLSWIPSIFLLSFSTLEVGNIKKSRYWNIPWSIYNVTKLAALIVLFALSITDLMMAVNIFGLKNTPGVLLLSPLITAVSYVRLNFLV